MKVDIIITYVYMLCHVLVCSIVILQRVVVLLCCGLSFGIATLEFRYIIVSKSND